jgi:peptidase E
MKLLLTSSGLHGGKVADFFLKILPTKPKDCSVLLVSLTRSVGEKWYVNYSKKALLKLGFKKIIWFNLKDKKFVKPQENFDILYVLGGETFVMLKRMRLTGFAKFVKGLEKNKKIIFFGSSASSIIAGPNIAIAAWGSDGETNKAGLKNFTGLGLTKTAIYPHYESKFKQEVEDFKKKVKYPVLALSDGQALFVDGRQQKIIR